VDATERSKTLAARRFLTEAGSRNAVGTRSAARRHLRPRDHYPFSQRAGRPQLTSLAHYPRRRAPARDPQLLPAAEVANGKRGLANAAAFAPVLSRPRSWRLLPVFAALQAPAQAAFPSRLRPRACYRRLRCPLSAMAPAPTQRRRLRRWPRRVRPAATVDIAAVGRVFAIVHSTGYRTPGAALLPRRQATKAHLRTSFREKKLILLHGLILQ